ncbi:unnamed protein product [Trichobilharzia regenti]|nr:unnamed protein product [Trichobilharzia regenti]
MFNVPFAQVFRVVLLLVFILFFFVFLWRLPCIFATQYHLPSLKSTVSPCYLMLEQLTCPTCKINRKDAILTKCFHVFCLNCLKVRYETRNRKCPKCNATFGANDYHRIYLT